MSAPSSFQSTSDREGSRLILTMAGEADLESTDVIGRFLDEAHTEALRMPANEVSLDLTGLLFLSSSGIKHFVVWLRRASELTEGGYRVRFISSRNVPWQGRSLKALTSFAPEIVTVDTVPA